MHIWILQRLTFQSHAKHLKVVDRAQSNSVGEDGMQFPSNLFCLLPDLLYTHEVVYGHTDIGTSLGLHGYCFNSIKWTKLWNWNAWKKLEKWIWLGPIGDLYDFLKCMWLRIKGCFLNEFHAGDLIKQRQVVQTMEGRFRTQVSTYWQSSQ